MKLPRRPSYGMVLFEIVLLAIFLAGGVGPNGEDNGGKRGGGIGLDDIPFQVPRPVEER